MHRLPPVFFHHPGVDRADYGAARRRLVVEHGEGALVVRLIGTQSGCFQLLLEEKTQAASTKQLELLGLTPREAEVLWWILQGKTNSEIGTILDCATGTISKHTERILSKLGVETRTAAALIALEAIG
jgi:DNA-binding CsgD family transcriptional regulator